MNEQNRLDAWYQVSWDDDAVYRSVAPPGGQPWQDQFRWADIVRICFAPGDFLSPDELYFFTRGRAESYLIPLEAAGAAALWGRVIETGLFDADLAIRAATASSGIFCWPELDDG